MFLFGGGGEKEKKAIVQNRFRWFLIYAVRMSMAVVVCLNGRFLVSLPATDRKFNDLELQSSGSDALRTFTHVFDKTRSIYFKLDDISWV